MIQAKPIGTRMADTCLGSCCRAMTVIAWLLPEEETEGTFPPLTIYSVLGKKFVSLGNKNNLTVGIAKVGHIVQWYAFY